MTRAQDQWQVGTHLSHSLNDGMTGKVRHILIGDNQVSGIGLSAQSIKGYNRVIIDRHLVARLTQDDTEKPGHCWLIVYDRNSP